MESKGFLDKDEIDVCLFLKDKGFDDSVASVFESELLTVTVCRLRAY